MERCLNKMKIFIETDDTGNHKYVCYEDEEHGAMLKLPINKEKQSFASFLSHINNIFQCVYNHSA